MLDVFNIPSAQNSDIQIFKGVDGSVAVPRYRWRKPRGISMVHILCVGGGGGGGGGRGAVGGNRGGGGAGGSSGQATILIQAAFLPDVLYVAAGGYGLGGAGGGSGTNGSAGSSSRVLLADGASNPTCDVLIYSGVAPNGGDGAAGGGGSGGGAGGGLPAIDSMPLAGYGEFYLLQGQAGVDGGSSSQNGDPIVFPTQGGFCQAGSGGAGASNGNDRIGGAFTAIADSWLSEQRPATPPAGSAGHGSGGVQLWKPFFSFGGGGGSSSDLSSGGNGGNGAYGAGGGGGGAGTGTTSGRGGDGGAGIVIITSW